MKALKKPKSCVNCVYFQINKFNMSNCSKKNMILWRELGKPYKICENYKEK